MTVLSHSQNLLPRNSHGMAPGNKITCLPNHPFPRAKPSPGKGTRTDAIGSAGACNIITIQNGGRRRTAANKETKEAEKCFNWSYWKRSEYKIIETRRWATPLGPKGTV